MTNYQRLDTASTESAIAKPLETVWNAALEAQNNPIQLLKILRELEKLHQEIRDTCSKNHFQTTVKLSMFC